jgi:diphthine synthase
MSRLLIAYHSLHFLYPARATTHTDIILRARALGIPTRVIHNASIINAVGACGLQLYNFGQTVSLVFFTQTWKPASFYDRVKENSDLGMHTLVLLDIKVKEQSDENLARLFTSFRFRFRSADCVVSWLSQGSKGL